MERDIAIVLSSATVCADLKRVPTDDGRGVKWIEDGHTNIAYVVEVDRHRVHALARKAYRNKNGRSVAGPVTVRIVKREKVEGVKHGR